jgi:hypothetical protein
MKTFSYYVTYHYEESGEVEALSLEEAREAIEDMAYVVGSHGYTVGWDYVNFHELTEISDDGEDDEVKDDASDS